MNTPLTALLKRTVVLLAALALAATTLLAAPAGAAEEAEDEKVKDFIQVRTNKTAAVVKGDTAWVTVSIRGKQDVDDVRFTAKLSDGTVAYPANTVDHSGPYNGYRLDKKETDYVAFQVTIPAGVDEKDLRLELDATWTHDGERMRGEESVRIPVVSYDGDPYTLVSDTATFSTTDPAAGWVTLSFAGLAPRVENFNVVVSDPAGLDIYYPRETFTSLAGDALLEDGETDVVRFRVGEAHWAAPMTVELVVDYEVAGVAAKALHTVAISPA